MVRVYGPGTRLCDGITRRELLRFGGFGALGLAGLAGGAAAAKGKGDATFGRARRLIFISLFGGPSHQDIWDMKPDAPREVRGEFNPIETNVSGIRITEHLPRCAKIADRYALIRSVTHADNGHGSAMYAAFTGFSHRFPNTNPIPDADDFPALGCVLGRVRPSPPDIPPFIAVGGTQFVCGNQIPGQRAGFLGPCFEPYVINGNPNDANFRVPELSIQPEIGAVRVDRRRTLLQAVEAQARLVERGDAARAMGVAQQRAFDLLTSSKVRAALDLSAEPAPLRDRYGRSPFGQGLLLARRLVEAGVPCTTVNWSTGGPWDTHGDNFPALKNTLLPAFDQTFTALLTDLHERGLLDSTLVLCTGEFGRTPQVNATAGRDHWAGCYTVVMAGGGIQGGRVHGASDASAAYPASDAVGPGDITATAYHCLGIPVEHEVRDRTNRPIRITLGEPIRTIL